MLDNTGECGRKTVRVENTGQYRTIPGNTGKYRKVQGSIGEYEYLKMQISIFVNVVMVLGIPEKLSKHTENIGMN